MIVANGVRWAAPCGAPYYGEGRNIPEPLSPIANPAAAVDALAPGKYQPRRHMDPAKLTELAESIRVQGVIQPIVVRQLPDRTFETPRDTPPRNSASTTTSTSRARRR